MGNTLKEIAEVGGKAEEWAHAMGAAGSTGLDEVERRGSVMEAAMETLKQSSNSMGGGKYQFNFPKTGR
jgi:hypothetical protein